MGGAARSPGADGCSGLCRGLPSRNGDGLCAQPRTAAVPNRGVGPPHSASPAAGHSPWRWLSSMPLPGTCFPPAQKLV